MLVLMLPVKILIGTVYLVDYWLYAIILSSVTE